LSETWGFFEVGAGFLHASFAASLLLNALAGKMRVKDVEALANSWVVLITAVGALQTAWVMSVTADKSIP
jgi:hypothetical protein